MAAIAGKVAITPKGEWDVATQYEKLDFILHGDDSYVARKASLGVEPGTDEETWQLSLRGASSQQINDILNGTTPVGDADSLGGETAEEWDAKIDGKLDKSGGTLTAPITIETDVYNAVAHKRTKEGLGTYKMVMGCGSTENGTYPSVTIEVSNESGDDMYGRLDIAKNGLFYTDDDGKQHEVFHKGNKPKGTYLGNGSSTQRTIAVNSLSQAIMVRKAGSFNFAVVSPSGYFGVLNGNFVHGSNVKESYGDLSVSTNSELFNASGETYEYQSL